MTPSFADRIMAIRDSVSIQLDDLAGVQFVRFQAYKALKIAVSALDISKPNVLEIGHSNGVILSFMPGHTAHVTGDFPAVDACDMPQFQDASYDVVVLDQVLEHVPNPTRAVAEVWRVLRVGGYAIIATPFLIRVHGFPDDYWRFTASGLRRLLNHFVEVNIGQWGNRFTLAVTMRHGWLSTWQTRRKLAVLLKNEPDWPLVMWAICRK